MFIPMLSFGQFNPPKDKVLHFVAGAAVSDIAYIVAYRNNNDVNKSAAIALCSSIFVGLVKETIDQVRYGGWDNRDLFATVLGGATVTVSFKIILNI
jgi:uncharacterized protein YfiM (DUF2279 family)